MTNDVLLDAYTRIHELVHRSVEGLDPGGLAFRPDADANSIAWLIWQASIRDAESSPSLTLGSLSCVVKRVRGVVVTSPTCVPRFS